MKEAVRVVQYGLGPIGCAVARLVVERDGVELVGAIDVDPEKVGRDAGEVIGLDRALGQTVVDNLGAFEGDADLAMHNTSSYFDVFGEQIEELLAAGMDVISTAEELSFPWLDHPQEGARIDRAARRAGRTVLATGVNPGFLLDSLPLFLTSICQRVDRIVAIRSIEASKRRGPFQRKIGAGLDVDEFESKMASGRMGHVGLRESMAMLFDTLGRELVRYESRVEPLLADRAIDTGYVSVAPGQVRGLEEVARGFDARGEFATLTLIGALEAGPCGDSIEITGTPSLSMELRGANGDLATVAILVNAIRRVREAPPGLVTMRDLPLIAAS